MTPDDEARVRLCAVARSNVPVERERGVPSAAARGGAPSAQGH
jgi:hypothetical protein